MSGIHVFPELYIAILAIKEMASKCIDSALTRILLNEAMLSHKAPIKGHENPTDQRIYSGINCLIFQRQIAIKFKAENNWIEKPDF